MENNMKNFDDLFRDALADHAEVPPRRVWESLEKRLDAPVAGAKPPRTGWYWYAGLASVALVVGSIALNWGSKEEAMAPVAVVAPVADNKVTPLAAEVVTPAETPATEDGQKKGAMSRHRTSANTGLAVHEAPKPQVSQYGNAPAVGTNLHSYDDFDERAVASAQKHTPIGQDEASANGYKVNKISKHRLVAAEMVPVGGVPTSMAAAPSVETTKTAVRPEKATAAANTARPATPVQRRPTVATKPVAQPAPADQATADVATTAPAVQPTADATPATRPASITTATTTRPAATSSPVASTRPKPAGAVTQSRPTTGGSEPMHVSDSGSAQDAASQDASKGKKKGFWNIFGRSKKNNSK